MTPGKAARPALVAVGLVVALTWVWKAPFSVLGTANLALSYALVAISLVVLTGWVGQISLAQASFVGVGAYVTGLVVRGWGVPFPLTLPVAAVATAGVAAGLGLVALRVRGLYLAVATLIFAWMAQEFLFNQPVLAGQGGSSSIPARPLGVKGTVPFLDFTERRTFYYVGLAALAAAILVAANLRDSKTGRAWFAVKGSEIAAASLGIPVIRYKLLAFATSGFLAGAAGCLVMTHQLVATSTSFAPNVSLFYLAIAVVGGLESLPGAVAGGVLFASLEELFFRVDALAGLLQIVSALLLAVVLLFFPAGLAGLPARLARLRNRFPALGPLAAAGERLAGKVSALRRRRTVTADLDVEDVEEDEEDEGRESRWRRFTVNLGERLPLPKRAGDLGETPDALAPTLASEETFSEPVEEEAERSAAVSAPPKQVYVPGTATKVPLPPRPKRPLILAARDITVRFGGLTAVDNAQLEVREGEIVGLIGPNGAGKTTLFNAISGLNEPTEGTVELYGRDITNLAVHERAALGMGRTFQMIQLFPQLTVFENLLVATHLRNPTGFGGHLVASGHAVLEERTARRRVRQVIALLGLDDVADRTVTGLPFGVLRMVEVARALVTGAPFIMLDEPASGLDNTETGRLTDLLLWVRQSLRVSLLLIEHDVKMVTGVTDYMYVIERGRPIADGTPADIQRDEAVIAAYLGKPAGEADDAPAAPRRRSPRTPAQVGS